VIESLRDQPTGWPTVWPADTDWQPTIAVTHCRAPTVSGLLNYSRASPLWPTNYSASLTRLRAAVPVTSSRGSVRWRLTRRATPRKHYNSTVVWATT